MTSTWQLFLNYAKSHPREIPADMKERAKLYKSLMDKCACGMSDPLCSRMGIMPKVKKQFKLSSDPDMMKTKIRALEDVIQDQAEEIRHLKSQVRASSGRRRSA